MFKNYLKIAVRNMKKHMVYSFINMAGLSLGMAVFIFISLYIRYELSYDKFHANSDRIYRLTGSGRDAHVGTPTLLGPALMNEFPEVKNFARIAKATYQAKILIKHKDKSFYVNRFYMADPSIFKVFTFPLIKGDPNTVLNNLHSVVINRAIAERCFGNEDPIGKTISFDNRFDFLVTGVAENVPDNSHFHFNFFIPFQMLDNIYGGRELTSWNMWNHCTYLLLEKNASVSDLKKKIDNFTVRLEDGSTKTFKDVLHLQPLTKIHHEYKRGNFEPEFEIKYIYIFIVAAFGILIIACINFMNLSTARSVNRANEIGLRKVVGATRIQLIKQFLGESLFLSFLALIFAVLLVHLFIPVFSSLTGTILTIDYTDHILMMGLIVTAVFVGIVSGGYPAFLLSSFQPVKVIKGVLQSGKSSLFRDVLVVFQFTISIILIISTVIISQQLNYIQNKKLGLNKDYIVNVPFYSREIKRKYKELKRECSQNPNILNVSAADFLPSKQPSVHPGWWEGIREDERASFWWYPVDHDFVETFEIEILEGRNFSKEIITDETDAYILNEAAVKRIGWKSAVGKKFSVWGERNSGTVVGVAKDFHFRSLHHEIIPCALKIMPERFKRISFKIRSDNISNTLSFIENKWKEFAPGYAFEYFFMDEEFDRIYKSEVQVSHIIKYFTILSIFISCLGLFGLASFITQQRTKEIGIRKALGASVINVLQLLSKEFIILVILSNIIAWPLAYYFMNKWIQDFAYHTNISILVFVLSAFLAIIVTLSTVSIQAVKAATANPVDSLKYE